MDERGRWLRNRGASGPRAVQSQPASGPAPRGPGTPAGPRAGGAGGAFPGPRGCPFLPGDEGCVQGVRLSQLQPGAKGKSLVPAPSSAF